MIELDSPRWNELKHAYGIASDTPDLLRQLDRFPASDNDAEPWFTLWSSLAHQGDVYSASFAAVPHVVRVLASDPVRAGCDFFQFPTWVEICRAKNNVSIPHDLADDYRAALHSLPELVALASGREWDEGFLCCAMAALAVSKGQCAVAEAALELSPQVAKEFMEWFFSR